MDVTLVPLPRRWLLHHGHWLVLLDALPTLLRIAGRRVGRRLRVLPRRLFRRVTQQRTRGRLHA